MKNIIIFILIPLFCFTCFLSYKEKSEMAKEARREAEVVRRQIDEKLTSTPHTKSQDVSAEKLMKDYISSKYSDALLSIILYKNALLYLRPIVKSVSGFGAKCDGKTDDTSAFNMAFMSVAREDIREKESTSGWFRFPQPASETIVMPIYSTCKISGTVYIQNSVNFNCQKGTIDLSGDGLISLSGEYISISNCIISGVHRSLFLPNGTSLVLDNIFENPNLR